MTDLSGSRERSPGSSVRALAPARSLLLSRRASRLKRLASLAGQIFLLLVTSASLFAVLFIFYSIARDAIPFFLQRGFREFFTSVRWYPTSDPAEFGVLAMIVGTALVTVGSIIVAVPMGIAAAVCLSDVLPFAVRQIAKPVIEMLAAIPSVAYGFFALVIFAPLLQEQGGTLLAAGAWVIGLPLVLMLAVIVSEMIAGKFPERRRTVGRFALLLVFVLLGLAALWQSGGFLQGLQISSGRNALNVSIILGIMAIPTIVSVSEDALQAAGRELREGAYALGATRAETITRVVIPAAASGICAAVILGVMRAVGETMVVLMAAGNATQIPKPWFNLLQPVRTLTATIAGEMGEADQVTGAARYHVLFAMALVLLAVCCAANLVSEWVMRRTRRKLGK